MRLISRVGLRRHSGCNWVQPYTSTLFVRGGHKMPCVAAPLCGECSSPISGQWTLLQLSRWPSYDVPRPAVKSACSPIPVVRSCYAVWSTSPRSPVHWWTADHGNGMAGRRGAVISWRHSSSIIGIAAVSQATQAGTSMHVMNALGPLLNTDTSHSPSSTVAGEVECYLAIPAVDWWREKMNSADS